MMQVVILIGVQATGKSTFFKERFADTHIRMNLDMLKTRHREKLILEACLQAGQSFVVDNTNLTVENRLRYIIPAKEAKFEVIGYYFESRVAAALQRNQQRMGMARIPVAGVRAAYHKLQIPSFNEGVAKLYVVKIDPQGSFLVEERHDDSN